MHRTTRPGRLGVRWWKDHSGNTYVKPTYKDAEAGRGCPSWHTLLFIAWVIGMAYTSLTVYRAMKRDMLHRRNENLANMCEGRARMLEVCCFLCLLPYLFLPIYVLHVRLVPNMQCSKHVGHPWFNVCHTVNQSYTPVSSSAVLLVRRQYYEKNVRKFIMVFSCFLAEMTVCSIAPAFVLGPPNYRRSVIDSVTRLDEGCSACECRLQ
jgi:hypothetical protein